MNLIITFDTILYNVNFKHLPTVTVVGSSNDIFIDFLKYNKCRLLVRYCREITGDITMVIVRRNREMKRIPPDNKTIERLVSSF